MVNSTGALPHTHANRRTLQDEEDLTWMWSFLYNDMKALTLAKFLVGGENKGEAEDAGLIGFETKK